MTKPRPSSNASPPLRLELGASRALATALVGIGVLAGVGLFLTDLPLPVATAATPACAAWGFVLARREHRRPSRHVVLTATGDARIDDVRVDDLRIDWQGPIAMLSWTVGDRRQRVVAWPDVLSAAQRRELRLWTLTRPSRAATAAVAP